MKQKDKKEGRFYSAQATVGSSFRITNKSVLKKDSLLLGQSLNSIFNRNKSYFMQGLITITENAHR
jgi:hypothetical protein